MKNAVLIMILLCEVWGISYAGWRNVPRSMMFYTQLSNAAAFFSALSLFQHCHYCAWGHSPG